MTVTRRLAGCLIGAAMLVGAAGCDPLVAPSGSAISLIAATNLLAPTGTTEITAIVLEGAAAVGPDGDTSITAGVGTPVHDGTIVRFTTTLGRIEPVEATTTAGVATVTLIADGRSGIATITAFSGPASQTVTVNIGLPDATP